MLKFAGFMVQFILRIKVVWREVLSSQTQELLQNLINLQEAGLVVFKLSRTLPLRCQFRVTRTEPLQRTTITWLRRIQTASVHTVRVASSRLLELLMDSALNTSQANLWNGLWVQTKQANWMHKDFTPTTARPMGRLGIIITTLRKPKSWRPVPSLELSLEPFCASSFL